MKFVEILDGGTVVRTSKNIRFTADPLLLAKFARHRAHDTCLDIGTGCGIIILWLCDRGLKGQSMAIDISDEACGLVSAGIESSGIDNVAVLKADARTYSGGPYSLIVCNPPYYKQDSGKRSPDPYRDISRTDSLFTLSDMAECIARNLAPDGRACFCIPPERYTDAEEALKANGLYVSRKTLVYNNKDPQDPRLLLIEAVKDPGTSTITDSITEN